MCYIKRTISVKTLLICVTNSSRLRKCFVQGHIHELFVSKALTRSYLARSGFDTNKLVNITPYKPLSMIQDLRGNFGGGTTSAREK